MSLTALNKKLKKIQSAVVVPGEEINGRYFDELTQNELTLYLRVSNQTYNDVLSIEKFMQNTEKPNLHFKIETRKKEPGAPIDETIKAIAEFLQNG